MCYGVIKATIRQLSGSEFKKKFWPYSPTDITEIFPMDNFVTDQDGDTYIYIGRDGEIIINLVSYTGSYKKRRLWCGEVH
jgi:hypothetical protein